jgi:NAD(P)-dependent dehydrogenase (short-subunit alcohol dehydrogenase family)
MASLAGMTAIVTGGASGIGRALVIALSTRGATTYIFDRDTAAARSVEEAMRARARKVFAMTVDVRDRFAVSDAVGSVVAATGRVDYMFNNAGITQFGAVQDYDWEAWHDPIDTDLYGVVHGVAACYPVMVKQGSGHIINTASLSGVVPTPWAVSYSAAKAGVWGLSMALRVEAAPLGIKVSCVCPAAVDTPIVDRARYINLDKERALATIPGKRISPESCADAILRGVDRNDAMIMPNAARWMSLAHRMAPGAVEKLMERISRTLSQIRSETLKKRA